jgi:hypothetical protein
MMNQQQPDNFFRQKLHNYQRPAPQGAWNKIESALEKKTQPKFVWWKVAAVFFLIAGAAYILWFNNTDAIQQPLARVEDKPTQMPETSELPKPQKPVEDQMIVAGENREPEAIRPPQSKKRAPQPIKDEVESPVATDTRPVLAKEDDTMPELQSHETVSHTVEMSETQVNKSTVTLTFSSEETSQYLNKNALAEATSDEKKPSSLKKFLKKANDLKSNQDPFGDLRERKNEILALNFKNDKRGQNK